ncbi:hypothetical protein C2M27_00065, partial [Escherichia coli]
FACRESHFSAYLTLWFPLLIWWTPLCLIRQILTRRFRLYAYAETRAQLKELSRVRRLSTGEMLHDLIVEEYKRYRHSR